MGMLAPPDETHSEVRVTELYNIIFSINNTIDKLKYRIDRLEAKIDELKSELAWK